MWQRDPPLSPFDCRIESESEAFVMSVSGEGDELLAAQVEEFKANGVHASAAFIVCAPPLTPRLRRTVRRHPERALAGRAREHGRGIRL